MNHENLATGGYACPLLEVELTLLERLTAVSFDRLRNCANVVGSLKSRH